MFQSIMDPNNEETKRLVKEMFTEPMNNIVKKAIEATNVIDVTNPAQAREQLELATHIMKESATFRNVALDAVYDTMQRQVDQFSTSVDVYNEKMKETFVQALDLYKQRIDTEIEVRTKVMNQKKIEHDTMLEASVNENKVIADNMKIMAAAKMDAAEKALVVAAKRDERDSLRKEGVLNRQRKKWEQELEREKKKDDQAHDRVMKELEIETSRYNHEFDLAKEAMRNAIAKGKSCHISHTAPKINWGPPPCVVPGSVSWRANN